MTGKVALIFHGIGTPARDLEPGEAPFWVEPERFTEILDRIAEARDPGGYEITFDDGNKSDIEIALPELAARGLSARFFVLSGRLGRAGSLDPSDLRELIAAGMVVGSHGIDHVAWPTLDDAALRRELTESKARLEDICGRSVTEAGIPFGRYDARVLRALRRAGYGPVWSSDRGRMRPGAFLRPRCSVRGDMDAREVEAVLAGYLSPRNRIRRGLGMLRRRWLTTG